MLLTVAFVAGVIVGSFLNVVIYRTPRNLSVVSPASACPVCQTAIKSRDNIPIFSWLRLGGKCRNCSSHISSRYPLVESATGALFALTTWRYAPTSIGSTVDLIALLYFASISISLAIIDIDTHTLPNRIVLPSYFVGIALMSASSVASGEFYPLRRAALGAALMWAIYFIMAMAYKDGMGFGDVKTAGALGLFLGYLGWKVLIVGAFTAFALGGIFALGLLISRKANAKSGIPFGPWMLVGAWIGIFLGGRIAETYLSLFGLSNGI